MNLILLAVIFTIIPTDCKSRKYDVEFEARKIYGQDLKGVLERFRRTPDYIKILNVEKEKLFNTLKANINTNVYYYTNKLMEKVYEVITENMTKPTNLRHKTTPGVYYTKYIGFNQKPIVRLHTHNMSEVERLELYWQNHSDLPLDVQNRMVNLGFEYCGYVLHGVIEFMRSFENSMSTLQVPDSGSKFPSTHYSHKITSPNGGAADKDRDETLRNFKKKA